MRKYLGPNVLFKPTSSQLSHSAQSQSHMQRRVGFVAWILEGDVPVKKVKGAYSFPSELRLRAAGRHLPYVITQ